MKCRRKLDDLKVSQKSKGGQHGVYVQSGGKAGADHQRNDLRLIQRHGLYLFDGQVRAGVKENYCRQAKRPLGSGLLMLDQLWLKS